MTCRRQVRRLAHFPNGRVASSGAHMKSGGPPRWWWAGKCRLWEFRHPLHRPEVVAERVVLNAILANSSLLI